MEGMTHEQKQTLKQNLISWTFGAVHPISRTDTFDAKNFYSNKDFATLGFVKDFMGNPDYHIEFLTCISSWKERSAFIADHAFLGTTYTEKRRHEIEGAREKYGFYQAQMR